MLNIRLMCVGCRIYETVRYWLNGPTAFHGWDHFVSTSNVFDKDIYSTAIRHCICSVPEKFLPLSHTHHHMGECNLFHCYHIPLHIPSKSYDLHGDTAHSDRLIIWQCEPRRKLWIPETPGVCIDTGGRGVLSGASNVATDFLILILPLPILFQLQMPFKKKLRFLYVFGIGLFACITSVVRLVYSLRLNIGADPQAYQLAVNRLGLWAWVKCEFVSLLSAKDF